MMDNFSFSLMNRIASYAANVSLLLLALGNSPKTHAQTTVTESFGSDPFWAVLNNSAGGDNYGYSTATSNAGGSAGEAGGTFGRHDAFDSYYADIDLGGTLHAGSSMPGEADNLQASGKIFIDSSQSGNGLNMSIAFFDQHNPTKGGNALRINLVDGNRFQLWLRLEIGKNLVSPLITGLADGQYDWYLTWDPNGSADQLGLGTATFTPPGTDPNTHPSAKTAVLDIPMRNEGSNPEWLMEDIELNAFGLHNYDGEADTANFYQVFIDDVTYLVASAPATTSAWGKAGSGRWTDSRNWNPGEVPFGNNETAVFGSGVAQNTTVFTTTDITVRNIDFDNAVFDYAVAGSSTTSLNLVADSGSATVDVIAGDHQFQIPVVLGNDTLVDADQGTTLSFNQRVDLAGNMLTVVKDGTDGTVDFNNDVILNGGTLSTSVGITVGLGSGDLTLDGTLEVTATGPIVAGDTFDLLDFDTLDTTFDAVVLPSLSSGLYWNTDSLYVDGTITAVPEPMSCLLLIFGSAIYLTSRRPRLSANLESHGLKTESVVHPTSSTTVSTRAIQVPVLRNSAAPTRVETVVSLASWIADTVFNPWHTRMTLLLAILSSPASAELIGQHFNSDPNWDGLNNIVVTDPNDDPSKKRDDDNHYTYFPATSNALGSAGEVGGYFGRNTFDAYYADTTLGGNLGGGNALQQPLFASGKFTINNDHNPNAAMFLGFFDSGNPNINGDRLNIMIAEVAGTTGFRPRLELRQSAGSDQNGNLETNLVEGHYNWTMDYDPNANGGNGAVTAVFVGPETVTLNLNLDPGQKNNALTLNAFGFQNYNAGGQTALLNKHYVFMDDVTYSTAETADPNVQWAGPGDGSWNAAFSWQRTSSGIGGGFVPDGADRTAILGSNITQDAIVFVDADVKVQEIRFDNASNRYSVAGHGKVSLDKGTALNARVKAQNGQHEVLTTLSLDSTTVVTTELGASLNLQGKLDLNGSTLIKEGSGTLLVNNNQASASGSILLNGGTLGGGGTIGGNFTVLPSGGTVAPGNSPGGLSITGNYVQNNASTLAVELGGLIADTQYDLLQVTGTATINNGATIDVDVLSGFVPVDGNIFDVVTASSINADPNQISLTGDPGFSMSIVNISGGQALRLTFGDSADFDGNGRVDGTDFLTWQQNFETLGGAVRADGDANLDENVNAADLAVWRNQFGNAAAATSASASLAIPEPTTGALIVIGAITGFVIRRGGVGRLAAA